MREWLKSIAWSYHGMAVAVAITLLAGNNWSWLSFWVLLGTAAAIGIALAVNGEIIRRRQEKKNWDRLREKVEGFRKNINAMEEK